MIATSVTVQTLTATIARALRNDPTARGRIERAAVLIALGAVERIDEATYRVASQTGDGTIYTVTPTGCACVDSQRHPGRWCKHQWAARITLAAEMQAERDQEQGARFPGLSAEEIRRLSDWRRRYSAAA
jgi:hypothetical protein